MENPETRKSERSSGVKFPVRSDLNIVYINTLILVILMIGISIIGIVFQSEVYPNEELSVVFVSNDIVNLVLGVPILMISLFLTMTKKLVGLLCYPGALFYITYVYTSYLLGLPFTVLFIPYIILITLSIYTIIGLILKIDSEQVQNILEGRVPIKTTGAILFAIACLIVIYQVYQIVNSSIGQLEVDQVNKAQWIVDLVIASPPLMIISFLMMRRKALGYSMGISILLLLGALFIGLVPIIIITAKLTGAPVNVLDIVIVSGSSMICVIPFILFARGIIKTSNC